MASSSNLHSLDNVSQPVSMSPTPTSPSFQIQPPNSARSFINLNPTLRGQSAPFPSTPTSSQMNSVLEPPHGTSFIEFVRTWTDSHVASWLGGIKCGRHAGTFKANDIRGDILLELDQDTLKEMGIASIGDRLRILNAVKSLRQKTSSRASNPTPPRVLVNGDASSHSTDYTSSTATTNHPPTSRPSRRLEAGRPAPLQLNANARENGLPRIVRDSLLPTL
jgi:mitogen-activated protein kinase kinase kinase